MLPKILLIHGLNNNLTAFTPLKEAFQSKGFRCELLCLPGHGEDRSENESYEKAHRCFEKTIEALVDDSYVVVAFSQGALYLQHWLNKTKLPKPRAQYLLAPALSIRRFSLLKRVLPLLPEAMGIPSLAPKHIFRYPSVLVREYHHLIEGILRLDKEHSSFPIPTHILVDPKDEVVDAKALKTRFKDSVTFLERPALRGRPGKHHILFHPAYFSKEDWEKFIETMTKYFSSEV